MTSLAEKNRTKFIDLLTERLVFERSGVKLYDKIVAVMERSSDAQVRKMLGEMHEHRNQEKEHEEWLEAQIRAVGGDAHGQTEMSQLVTEESQGIEQVVLGPAHEKLPHLFHALLTAELADNAGWDLLVQLAGDAGDHALKKEFKKRLHQEETHLLFVRKAMLQFAKKEVLGERPSMPAAF